jgi:transcriptional regulator with XRE-family HTH domain
MAERGYTRGAPPVAIRMDFAKRLQDCLNDKGWTQSELAKRMAPLLKESRIGRDNISKYVRGKVLPLPPALEAMAKVLGVESKDLLPSRVTQGATDELSPLDVRDIGAGRVWLQVNQAVDWDVALDVMKRIREGSKGGANG